MTSLLSVRFKWLLDKDYKSFGLDFKTYIMITMMVSFSTMIKAVYNYHVRHRSSLRPMFSLSTFVLVFCWALLIVCKVVVYVICFINTPALIFIPGAISRNLYRGHLKTTFLKIAYLTGLNVFSRFHLDP